MILYLAGHIIIAGLLYALFFGLTQKNIVISSIIAILAGIFAFNFLPEQKTASDLADVGENLYATASQILFVGSWIFGIVASHLLCDKLFK